MSDWWLSKASGAPEGPFSSQTLAQELRAGQIPHQAYVCRVGDQRWLRISQVDEIFAMSSQPAAVAPAAVAPAAASPASNHVAGSHEQLLLDANGSDDEDDENERTQIIAPLATTAVIPRAEKLAIAAKPGTLASRGLVPPVVAKVPAAANSPVGGARSAIPTPVPAMAPGVQIAPIISAGPSLPTPVPAVPPGVPKVPGRGAPIRTPLPAMPPSISGVGKEGSRQRSTSSLQGSERAAPAEQTSTPDGLPESYRPKVPTLEGIQAPEQDASTATHASATAMGSRVGASSAASKATGLAAPAIGAAAPSAHSKSPQGGLAGLGLAPLPKAPASANSLPWLQSARSTQQQPTGRGRNTAGPADAPIGAVPAAPPVVPKPVTSVPHAAAGVPTAGYSAAVTAARDTRSATAAVPPLSPAPGAKPAPAVVPPLSPTPISEAARTAKAPATHRTEPDLSVPSNGSHTQATPNTLDDADSDEVTTIATAAQRVRPESEAPAFDEEATAIVSAASLPSGGAFRLGDEVDQDATTVHQPKVAPLTAGHAGANALPDFDFSAKSAKRPQSPPYGRGTGHVQALESDGILLPQPASPTGMSPWGSTTAHHPIAPLTAPVAPAFPPPVAASAAGAKSPASTPLPPLENEADPSELLEEDTDDNPQRIHSVPAPQPSTAPMRTEKAAGPTAPVSPSNPTRPVISQPPKATHQTPGPSIVLRQEPVRHQEATKPALRALRPTGMVQITYGTLIVAGLGLALLVLLLVLLLK